MTIFENICGSNSFIHIDRMTEDALEHPDTSATDKAILQTILQSNDLDERHALAHEHLGRPEEAKKLRDWIIQRNARPSRLSDSYAAL